METKRLYRSRNDRKIGGVAAGLADYLVVDPLLIRLLFVILFFAGGGGLLIYIILWIVTPEQPFIPATGNTVPPSPENQAPPSQESWSSSSSVPPPAVTPESDAHRGSLIGGLVLITLGAIFLADEFIPRWDFGDLWPVLLIVIGGGLLINAMNKRNNS